MSSIFKIEARFKISPSYSPLIPNSHTQVDVRPLASEKFVDKLRNNVKSDVRFALPRAD